MVKILKRCLLLGKKVLYKSPIHIAPLSSTLHAVNGPIFILAKLLEWLYLGDGTPQKKKLKKCSVNSHILTHSCQFMSQNVQIPIA